MLAVHPVPRLRQEPTEPAWLSASRPTLAILKPVSSNWSLAVHGRKRPTRTLEGGRIEPASLPRGPNGLPLCRWCDLEILAKRRRTFCSEYCVDQWRLRTDPGYLRDRVFARDKGICADCGANTVRIFAALKRARGNAREEGLRFYGMKSITSRRSLWDADHILPVAEGGGQCDLDNLRTLCLTCHREATARLRERLKAIHST